MNERTLPHNLDAEKSVLGSVLISNHAINHVLDVIEGNDFFRDAHRRIWEKMLDLTARNEPVDFLTLTNELTKSGELDEVGGPAYISSMTEGVPRSANVKYYARIVRDMSRLRQLVGIGSWISEKAYDADIQPSELLSEASGQLSGVSIRENGGAVSTSDAVMEYVSSVASGTAPLPIQTGLTDLDALVHGIRPKELVIVAARPSVGKTAFTLGLAERLASKGNPGVVFTLEVSTEKLSSQMLAWRSGVPSNDIESGIADESAYARVGTAASGFSGLPLYIVESANTLLEVSGWCRRLHREHGLKFAFIDYLQLMSLGEKAENRQIEISRISRGLKLLAKELGISIVALSQLGRSSEARKDKRPHLSDLRESGALEQDADMAILLFRPEMYSSKDEDAGIAEVIVAKNRNGPSGTVQMAIVKQLAKFDNLLKH